MDDQVKVWSGTLVVGDNVISVPGLGQAKALVCLAVVETASNASNASYPGRIRVSTGFAVPGAQYASGTGYDYLSSQTVTAVGVSTSGIISRVTITSNTAATFLTAASVTAWGVDTVTINATYEAVVTLVLFGGADCKAEIVTGTLNGTVVPANGTKINLALAFMLDSLNNNAGTIADSNTAFFQLGSSFIDPRGALQNLSAALSVNDPFSTGTAIDGSAACSVDTLTSGSGQSITVTSLTETAITFARSSTIPPMSNTAWLMVEMPGWAFDYSLECTYPDRDTISTGAYELGQPDAAILFGGPHKRVDFTETRAGYYGRSSVVLGAFDGDRCGSVSVSINAGGVGSTTNTHGVRAGVGKMSCLAIGTTILGFEFDNPTFDPYGFTLPLLSANEEIGNISRLVTMYMKKVLP